MEEGRRIREFVWKASREMPCLSKAKSKEELLLLYSYFPEEGRDIWLEETLLEFRGNKDKLFNFLHKLIYHKPYPQNCYKGKAQFLYLLKHLTKKRGTARYLLNLLF